MHHIPNMLTCLRLMMTPIVVSLIFLGTSKSAMISEDPALFAWIGLGFFAVAGITDYLDGYLARSLGWISRLGRLMDPIADKVLVISVIAALLSVDRLQGWHFIPALIIIIREICVAGLREFFSTVHHELPVSFSSKVKTAIQMISLSFLIAAPAADSLLPASIIGLTLLWLAAAVTILSAYEYVRGVMPQFDSMLTDDTPPFEDH